MTTELLLITDLQPNGPYAWTLSALLGIAIVMSWLSSERRELVTVGLLMAGNWVFAQVSSDTGNIGVAAVGNIAAGVLLVLWRTEIALAIAVLYVFRIVTLAGGQFNIIPIWLMWEISNIFLILQITILAGGSLNGTRKLVSRCLDVAGRWLVVVPGVQGLKRQLIDPFGPFDRIDRPPFQKG